MALTITEPQSELTNSSNAATYAMTAFTPAANSLLVVMAFVDGNAGAAMTVSGGGLTWTRFTTCNTTSNSGADRAVAFYAQCGASPSSTTVTLATNNGNAAGITMGVVQVSGHNQTNPIAQDLIASGSGANPSITRAAANTLNGYIAGFGCQRITSQTTTPPTSWTEVMDVGHLSNAVGGSMAYRATGETSTTVTFTSTAPTANNWALLYVEINEATQPPITGSGSGAVSSFAGSGAGTETFTGSGSGVCSSFAGSGAATETFTGSGSGALSSFDGTGAATETFTGSGSGVCTSFGGAGTVVENFVGTGSGELSSFAGLGTAFENFLGNGSGALPAFDGAGAAFESVTGSGSGVLSTFDGAGESIEIFIGLGSGELAAFDGIGTGSGQTFLTGSGSGELSSFAGLGTAFENFLGNGSGALPAFDGAGEAGALLVAVTGFGSGELAAFVGSGLGYSVTVDTVVFRGLALPIRATFQNLPLRATSTSSTIQAQTSAQSTLRAFSTSVEITVTASDSPEIRGGKKP